MLVLGTRPALTCSTKFGSPNSESQEIKGTVATYARDLQNNAAAVQLSAPAAQTSTVTGAATDCITYAGPITIIQACGVLGGSSPTLAGKIQQSDDTVSGNFADITGATFGSVTVSTNVQTITVHNRTKRYIRYVGTIGGSSPTINFGAVLVSQLQQV